MASDAIKLARIQAKENERTRLYGLVAQPAVLGFLVMAGGLYAANRVKWDEDEVRNADVRAIVSAGAAMAGLASCGVKDRWLLGGVGVAAGLSGLDPVDVSGINTKEIIDVGASTAIGAAIGTAIFPVVGTVVGGAIGGGAGYGVYRATGGK